MRAWLLPIVVVGLSFVPTGSAESTCVDTSFFEPCASDAPADCASSAEDDAAWSVAYGLFATGGQGAGLYTTCEADGGASATSTRLASGGNPRVASTGVTSNNNVEAQRTTTDDGNSATATCTLRVTATPRVAASPQQPPAIDQAQSAGC